MVESFPVDYLVQPIFPNNWRSGILLISVKIKRQLHVLGRYRNGFRMNSAQIHIFAQLNQVVLACEF